MAASVAPSIITEVAFKAADGFNSFPGTAGMLLIIFCRVHRRNV